MKHLTIITLLTPAALWANGGGYHIGTKLTGDVAPFQPAGTEHIQILEEDLDITLRDESAKVRVLYTMKNTRDEPVEVTFGFPVEVVHQPLRGYTPGPDGKPPRPTNDTVRRYCTSYHVSADRKYVASKYQPEPFGKHDNPEFPGAEVLRDIQGWMVSTVLFDRGETRDIHIRYDSQYDDRTDYLSNDTHAAPLTFRYRLSTGGVWAGPIKSGTVTVIATEDIYPEHVAIDRPVNRFVRDGNRWTWSFTDLEPTLADDITVHARPAYDSYPDNGGDGDFAQFIRTGDRWQRLHADYKVTASSTLAQQGQHTFGVDHLQDGDWRSEDLTAWIEGADGDGTGEHLDLVVNKPLPLDAIEIRPGYGKTKLHFEEHGRPWKIQLELNGEHTVTHKLRGINKSQRIHLPDYDKPVKTVRLTILSVLPGKRFDDTAIANLRLLARLSKKPTRYGAR